VPSHNAKDSFLIDDADLIIEMTKPSCYRKLIFKFVAIIAVLWALIILATETTVIFDYTKTIVYWLT